MEYQVVRSHIFRDNRGNPLQKEPGDRIEVGNRYLAKQLLAQGTILPLAELTPTNPRYAQQALGPISLFECQHRVGFCVHTSPYYSR